MRIVLPLLLVGLLLTAPPASAQDSDGPVLYMTQHKIAQARMDSLSTLISELDIPWHNYVASKVEGYQRYFMVHDTGNEYNLQIATMYPSWDMVDSVPYDDYFPEFAETMGMSPDAIDAKYRPGFTWAYEGSEHMDQIWRPVASTRRNMSPDMLGDAVIYMTQLKVKAGRVDSLATLVNEYQVKWHDFVAENVPGYERHWMRHDTGNGYNFMIGTVYPSWDMVDSIPYAELFPKYVESMGMTMEEAQARDVQSKMDWAYEGSQHMDQIWRPIAPADM